MKKLKSEYKGLVNVLATSLYQPAAHEQKDFLQVIPPKVIV